MKKIIISRKNLKLSIEDVKKLLPHRYPFLMIDRVLEQKEGYCKTLKNVSINEIQFLGHFPEFSIMPGVLIAEAIIQSSAFVGQPEEEKNSKIFFVTSVNIKFLHPVIPGDQVIIEVWLKKKFMNSILFEGKATVDNTEVAKCEFTLAEIK